MSRSPRHIQELAASAIDPKLAALNCSSTSGDEIYDRFFASTDINQVSQRTWKDAQWRYIRKAWGHLEHGALIFTGFDPDTNWETEMDWLRVKPVQPKPDYNKPEKARKYESPPKTPTRVMYFRVSLAVWREVAVRTGVAMPCNITITSTGEALGFWQWVEKHPEIPITLTEGEKKALCLLSQGRVAIALPGIWNGQRKLKDENGNDLTDERGRDIRILHPDLERLAVKGRTVYFAFDRDKKPKTRRNVSKAIAATGKLLKARGCKVKVVVWDHHQGKGVDDFVVNGGNLDAAYQFALPLELYQTQRHSQLTYRATQIQLTQDQPYIGQHDIQIPDGAKLIGVKGPKGVGKTEWLDQVVTKINNAFEENHGRPMPIILLTHRRNLGAALAERFGLPVAHELKEAGEGGLFGYALCVDSMHKLSQVRFDPSDYENAIVIVDEIEQVLWHLLDASTEVAKHRVEILKNYRLLLSNVLNSDHGKVFVADADLSDVSLNHILEVTELRNQIQPFVIEAHLPVEPGNRTCYCFDDNSPDKWLYALIEAIKRGERPLVMVSGQQSKTTWGTQSIERRIKELCPFADVLRVDSDTTKQPGHPAYRCMNHLNEVVYSYDAVIASPTIETGISIKDKNGHFTSVWGLSWGLQTEEAFRQALARLRTDVPRYVWCVESSALGRIGNGSLTPYHLLKSGQKKTEVVLKQLRKSDADIQEWLYDFQTPSQKAWSELAARINGGMMAYRDAVLRGLHGEGYEIRPFEFVESGDELNSDHGDPLNLDTRIDAGEFDGDCEPLPASHFEQGFEVQPSKEELKEVVKALKESRDRNWREHNEAIVNAESLTDHKYEELRRSNDLTPQQRHQVRKFELQQRYGGDLTPELLAKDDKGSYPQWALHYRLTKGREFLLAKDGHHIDGAVERDGALWFPDVNRRSKLPTVAALEAVGFGAIAQELTANQNRQWREDDPLLTALAKNHKRHPELREFISIPVNPKYADRPIPVVNGYLRVLGLKLEAIRRERVNNGGRLKVYQLTTADKEGHPTGLADGRMEFFERWVSRDRALTEKWEREKAEKNENRVQQDAVQGTAGHSRGGSKGKNRPLSFTRQGIEGGSKSPYIEINIGDLDPPPNETRNADYPSEPSASPQPLVQTDTFQDLPQDYGEGERLMGAIAAQNCSLEPQKEPLSSPTHFGQVEPNEAPIIPDDEVGAALAVVITLSTPSSLRERPRKDYVSFFCTTQLLTNLVNFYL